MAILTVAGVLIFFASEVQIARAQSEDWTLSVALRRPAFGVVLKGPFGYRDS
ncbi:MAG: hypothetical protein WBQ25_02290 [Nitrososphaeraceae archaeon]